MAGWQSGHAAACKAVDAGSIPTPASINQWLTRALNKDLERLLLPLLPNLKVAVLVGQKAAKAKPTLLQLNPALRIMQIRHPSPLFVNRSPENQGRMEAAFMQVVAVIDEVQLGI